MYSWDMGGEGGWLIRDYYLPINFGPLIKLFTRENHPYAPLIILRNLLWFRGVPTFTFPFTALSLVLVMYSLVALQRNSSASLFF